MDPLSLAANVLAVVGAAQSTLQALKRVKDARFAPNQISQLLDEVADFERVIVTVTRTLSGIGQQPVDPGFNKHLASLIQRAMDQVTQINRLAEDGWIRDLEAMNEKSATAAWKRWLRSKDVGELLTSIHSIRQDLAAALTVLTASELPHTRNALREIVLKANETGKALAQTTSIFSDRIDSITTQLSTISPQIHKVNRILQDFSAPPQPPPPVQRFLTSKTASRRGSSHSACTVLCICNCHKSPTFKSPHWANSVVGVILLSWSGVLGRPICNEKRCKRSQGQMLKLKYYFPSWFIRRVIYLQYRSMTLDNHEFKIKVARSVPQSSPVVIAAVEGDLAWMQNLFRTGLASPFDVSEFGTTLLSNAIGTAATLITDGHVDMCRFLLQQAADPYQEDEYLRSPIHYAWTLFLLAPKKPQVQALKAMLDQYLDPEEDLKPFRLTILHQIVLGLTQIDLSAQLEYSTADIDVGCSMRKTPLCWAVHTRNELMVKKLLDFHARVDLQDKTGDTVFHRVIQEDLGYEILETLISAAYSQQDSHSTFRSVDLDSKNGANTSNAQIGVNPSVVAILDCMNHNGHTPLSLCSLYNHYSYAQILLTHGATVGSFAFMVAVQYHAHHIVELLLNAGAITNCKDEDGMTVLHVAGACCNIEMMRILKDAKLCCLDVEERDKAGMTPLEEFDIGRAQWHSPEDEGVRRRCREAFLELLASVRGVGDGHVCTRRGRRILNIEEEKAGIFDDDVGKSSSLLDDSDEDEFFNACADFGKVT